MKYSFKKTDDWIVIEVEGKNETLTSFSNGGWTSDKIQLIIDGVENTKTNGLRYEWANEDIHLVAIEDGVYFYDLLARRADKNHPKGQDLDLSHNVFIGFLNDFKKFIEENS